MLALLIADLHSQRSILKPLEATVKRLQPDAVFCLGDLTVHGPTAGSYTEQFLEACDYSARPVLCISGNNDASETLAILRDRKALLDEAERTLFGERIIGIGYEAGDPTFQPNLAGSILLTHVPPRKKDMPKEHLSNAPKLHCAGHLHRYEQTWTAGITTIVQVPTAMHFRAATIELPTGKISFIDLAPKPGAPE